MLDLPKDTLQLLIDTARSGQSTHQLVEARFLPDKTSYLLIDGFSGTSEVVPIPEATRKHVLLSVSDVIAWANDYAEKVDDEDVSKKVSVWISDSEIAVTPEDRVDRLLGHRAVYEFRVTPVFELLLRLADQSDHDVYQQKAFLKLLRTTLFDSFAKPESRDFLIKTIRNVVATQVSNIQSGKGTYEAGFQTNEGDAPKWPERLSLIDYVYLDDLFTTPRLIDTVLEVDATAKTFALWPTASSLETAKRDVRKLAEEHIRTALKNTDIRVYSGSPE